MFGSLSNFTLKYDLEEVKNEIKVRRDNIVINGVQIPEVRLTRWMSDENYTFKYGGKVMQLIKMTKTVKEIQKLINVKYGEYFDSVLANYYENGN